MLAGGRVQTLCQDLLFVAGSWLPVHMCLTA